jgi:hypothetical protein
MLTGSIAIVYEKLSSAAINSAKAAGLRLSAVRLEDLCVYLTQEDKEGELECLWQRKN